MMNTKGRQAVPEEVQRRERIAKNLRELRLLKGWKGRPLARAIGKDSTWLAKVESAIFAPKADDIQLLAETLEVHPWEITGDAPPEKPPVKPAKPGVLKPKTSTPLLGMLRDRDAFQAAVGIERDNILELDVPSGLVAGLTAAEKRKTLEALKERFQEMLDALAERLSITSGLKFLRPLFTRI